MDEERPTMVDLIIQLEKAQAILDYFSRKVSTHDDEALGRLSNSMGQLRAEVCEFYADYIRSGKEELLS